ncbi:hypothetical protein [Amycolatopsis sp. Hca4]|uniref:hypothetical protein n=1 Tax=Amycolatopsis sp. Hca4 TaxID=2742131 RepID=UPI001591F58E|nr:hypothetical protein [Amycolatopsis sp. Hca4]QKV75534.1 hypothetical protein HUT10_18490 [Amycolatopsis sp. Hca4]
MTDSFAATKADRDERAVLHAASPDHAFARFAEDPAHLSGVVRFDRPRRRGGCLDRRWAALLENGSALTAFAEHDSVPWNALPGRLVLDEATGEWRLATTYTLQAVKGG